MSDRRPRRPYSNGTALPAPRSRLPAELGREIATTRDGRDITRPWVHELEEYRDRRLQGALDWGVYDRILLDDQVKSCLEQRRSAVVSREWNVLPGDAEDPRAVAAAEALKANLLRIGWDRVTEKMLRAPFYGIAIAELIWEVRDGLFQWSQIKVRHARRFRYDAESRLRLITMSNQRGEIMPERKFWVVTAGADDDDQPYGRGLAEWLYWPTLFKRNGIRFWNIFLDKFSVPPAKGTYRAGTPREEIDKLLQSMAALANDSGIALPEGVAVEFMQIATAGIDFEKMPAYMDQAIAKIILSQTMTTQDGASLSQAQVHEGVKKEVVTADADLLTDSFTAQGARWFTDLNFGPDVAAPIVTRLLEEETDTKASAETDAVLARIGYRRTEESFKDVYGDGYERGEPVDAGNPGSTPGQIAVGPRKPEPANDDRPGRKAVSFAAGDPRTLYVHRRLKNAKALRDWARRQGFRSALPAGEMHVTVAYSKRPVDWFAIGQSWQETLTVPAGGPRQVERLGERAIVLLFAASELTWRHQEMREAGASWDYPEYRPHVTITYDGEGIDLDAIEPYQGELVFGPEIFEQLDEGWADEVSEVSFAEAAEADIVDEATAQIMADEGWRQDMAPMVEQLLEQLVKARNENEVAAILARADLVDEGPLAERLARAGFAVRLAAATGADA
jgi:phage gp29-like protein